MLAPECKYLFFSTLHISKNIALAMIKIDSIYKKAVQLSRDLIQIPSESSEPIGTSGPPETTVSTYITKLLTAHKIDFTLQEALAGRHNIIVSMPKANTAKVLFLAHMDTVSGQGMSGPFNAKITEKAIFGRGACDDKGPLATLLASLIYMKESAIQQNYDITLVCTVDEENTMAGSAFFEKKRTEHYDICVALEPSLLQPISKHIGVYRCRIFPAGSKKMSPPYPPLEKKREIIQDILTDLVAFKNELQLKTDTELGRTNVTLTELDKETTRQAVSGRHRILVDIRMLPSQSPKSIHERITSIVGGRGKVILIFAGFGIDSEPTNPFIQKFRQSLARQGLSDKLIGVPFPSDCSQMRGLKTCLVWGPGDPKHAHSDEEHIELSQIYGACRFLTDFLFHP